MVPARLWSSAVSCEGMHECCVQCPAGSQQMAVVGLMLPSCSSVSWGLFFWNLPVPSLACPHNPDLPEMYPWGTLLRPQVPITWDELGRGIWSDITALTSGAENQVPLTCGAGRMSIGCLPSLSMSFCCREKWVMGAVLGSLTGD